ncbi:MAG: ABC transporter substrate-binding protein, partial [Heyndrickxia sp.]
SGNVPYTDYMAKQSYMKENKDTIEKFVRALYKAAKWVEDHDSTQVAKVVQPFFEDTDIDILASSIDRYRKQGSFGTDLVLNEDGWNNLQNIMSEAGELPKKVDYKTLVNTSITKKAIKE